MTSLQLFPAAPAVSGLLEIVAVAERRRRLLRVAGELTQLLLLLSSGESSCKSAVAEHRSSEYSLRYDTWWSLTELHDLLTADELAEALLAKLKVAAESLTELPDLLTPLELEKLVPPSIERSLVLKPSGISRREESVREFAQFSWPSGRTWRMLVTH